MENIINIKQVKATLIVIFLLASILIFAENQKLTQAKQLTNEKKFEQAENIYKELLKENPDNAEINAYYGLMIAQECGTVNMLKAAMLTNKAYKYLDRAIELDENLLKAYLYRGILSVNVPKFLGKLDKGIEDLKISMKSPDLYNISIFYLAYGYEKQDKVSDAIKLYKEITLYQKDSDYFKSAKKRLDELQKNSPEIKTADKSHFEIAKTYLEKKESEKARTEFELASKQEPDNLQLHLLYAKTLGELAQDGYNEKISEDVQYMAQIAQDVKNVMDQCVKLAPNSMEIRTMRGTTFIHLPFFVKSLKTGIEDLKWIIENSKDENQIQQMKHLLKSAEKTLKERKLTDSFLEAENQKQKEEIIEKILAKTPTIEHNDSSEKYMEIAVEFGFKDYIAPQISLWIEDEAGNYLETLYVSKFSAEVKAKQVHLIKWAKSSKFEGIEAVSGASIDSGKHIFKWDLTKADIDSDQAYTLNIEICHWPHVKYKHVEIPVNLKDNVASQKENFGNLIYSVQTKVIR